MTLEEKVHEIAGGWEGQVEVIDPTGTFTNEQARIALGKLQSPDFPFTARQAAILRNGVQRYLKEKSRLGIPALFMGEALHGYMEYGSTSSPQALGLASTWDPALVKRVFTAAGDEAGARGAGQAFSPVLDIARDPRWGRTEETYGEDPYLASRMGVAAIEGLQGDDWMINRHHVVATAKHFAVHGQPEGGTSLSGKKGISFWAEGDGKTYKAHPADREAVQSIWRNAGHDHFYRWSRVETVHLPLLHV